MYAKLQALRAQKDAEDRGFTLIELLVVVVIIGVLIAIAIPLYLNYQKGARDKSTQSDLRQAVSSIQSCYADNASKYPASVDFTSGTGIPDPSGCANDKINLSSGVTMVYSRASDGLSFTLAASNSGGNRNADSTTLGSATAAGSSYYFYSSSTGGSIQ